VGAAGTAVKDKEVAMATKKRPLTPIMSVIRNEQCR